MPRLTILIPCLGGATDFDGTLVSVLQNRPANCEVLVLHTEPYNDPYNLQGEVRFVRVTGQTTLAGVINAGIEAAEGQIVHVLSCGLEVEEGWTTPALVHFSDDELAAVAPAICSANSDQTVASGVSWSRGGSRRICQSRSFQVIAPTLHAGFFRREVIEAIGGFESNLGDGLADVGLGITLRELGLKTICEPKSRVTQVAHELPAVAHKPLGRARRAERLFWRTAARQGLALSLLVHSFSVLGDLLQPAALVGRLIALLELGAVGRYQTRILDIAGKLGEVPTAEKPTLSLANARVPAASPAQSASSTRRKAA